MYLKPTMSEREPVEPLVIAAVIALLVHVGMISFAAPWLMERPTRSDRPKVPDIEPVLPEPKQVKLGDDVPRTSAVAWIPYEDFRELIAPQSMTEQPALQQQADPVPDAPLPVDPTPPAPSANAQAAAQAPGDTTDPITTPGVEAIKPADQPIEMTRQPDRRRSLVQDDETLTDGQLATATPSDQPQPDPQQNPDEPTPPDAATRDGRPRQDQQAAADPRPANPTAAPRTDSESPPVKLRPYSHTVKPGGVLVSEGIRIKTVRPRFTIVTLLSALPETSIAKIVFDHRDGRVIQVELIKSSEYPGVDGPIVASLYKWRASGPLLSKINRPLEMQVTLILAEQ